MKTKYWEFHPQSNLDFWNAALKLLMLPDTCLQKMFTSCPGRKGSYRKKNACRSHTTC